MQGDRGGAVSFVVAFVVVRLLLTRFARFALDRPNARSLHEQPVPRTGGIAVLAGIAACTGLRRRGALAAPRPRVVLAALSF